MYHHSGDWEGREVYHHWWLGGQGGVSSLRVQGSQPDTEVCPGGKAVSGLGAPGILTGTGRLVQYKQVEGIAGIFRIRNGRLQPDNNIRYCSASRYCNATKSVRISDLVRIRTHALK